MNQSATQQGLANHPGSGTSPTQYKGQVSNSDKKNTYLVALTIELAANFLTTTDVVVSFVALLEDTRLRYNSVNDGRHGRGLLRGSTVRGSFWSTTRVYIEGLFKAAEEGVCAE